MSSSSTAIPPEPAQYLQTWADVLGQVLGEISGSAMPCALLTEAPAGLTPAADDDFRVLATSSGAVRGEMSLRLPAASVVRLAQIFMSEPAAPAAEATAEQREAVLELLRQAGGLAATAIAASLGEVQLRLEAAPAAPSWPAALTAWLRAGDDSPTAPLLEIHLSAALVATLRVEAPPPAAAAPTPPVEAEPAPAAPAAPLAPHDERVNLGVLMDVEMSVTLRFGSRQLLLREVLDLNPGSVVELDRQVQEPVDMLLDGRVVARGELVVMGGNYGMRVTEVAPAG